MNSMGITRVEINRARINRVGMSKAGINRAGQFLPTPSPLLASLVHSLRLPFIVFLALGSLSACSPRVEVAAPDKPITINLNVKIDHEVKIQVEKDLEQVFSEESELF